MRVDPINIFGPVVVGVFMGVSSIVYLSCPETVRQLALTYAIFTPDDWINRPGYLTHIRARGVLSGITAAVLLFIGFWNLMQ